ncbi:MAG: helix-turn-helix domain-containing protein [Actinomycetota bacterium]
MVISANGSVGTRLREARSARGVDLDEAFEHTRINKRFLEALERDAPPREFPAPVYARAFLEEYARYLGLDPDPLVADYRRTHGDPEEPPIRLPVPVETPRGPWGRILLTVASTMALVAIAVFAVRAGREGEPVTPRGPVGPPPAATLTPPTTEPTEPARESPAVRGVRLKITVTDTPAWIRVLRGEEVLYQETAQPGFSRTFRAGPNGRLDVRIGNAGAVRLTLNGDPLGLAGEPGQIYEAGFVFRNGRAVVTEPG